MNETWSRHGWCRLERVARDLTRTDGYTISVEIASRPALVRQLGGISAAPGEGSFSFQADREKMGPVISRMIWSKLHAFLIKREYPKYRMMLNLQHRYLAGTGVDTTYNVVPNFSTGVDPCTDPAGVVVARFLHENGFKNIADRDEDGWSPMCYAVLRDDTFLVESLLKSRADANEVATKEKKDAHISKKSSVLSIASIFSSNKVLKQLLSARADVKARDYFGGTALSVAAAYNNADAVRILWEAGIDPRVRAFPGASAFKLACCFDSLQSMKEIMKYFPVSLRFSLHFALAFVGDGDTISSLIKASADINEQLAIPPGHGSWWMILKGLSLRHSFSSSALTYLAYHHRGATPLMFSIMTGKFGATSILLDAGALLDIRNSRGKTAEDILRETQAPISLSSPCLSPSSFAKEAESDSEADPMIVVAMF